MNTVDYFYTDTSGKKQGPIKEQQLRKLAAQGTIYPSTPVETTSGHKGTAKQIPGIRFNGANPNPFTATERAGLAKRAEGARLEAEMSTIVAEVATEKEAAATMRAANAIKAADKMNAIAEKAERKLQQFATRGSTSGSNLLPGIVISILAMLLIGGVIGTVAWAMFSGTNSTQRQDNAKEPVQVNQAVNANNFRENGLRLDNPFEDPTVEWKTDNPFAN